jgi:predicted nucleotidyltransferase
MLPSHVPERDQAALAEFARRVRSALGPRLVELRLFGSKARGDATSDSDLDVAVMTDGPSPGCEDEVVDIAFDVDLAYDVYISPRVLPASVLSHPVWSLTGFVRAVEREGISL